MNPSSWAKRRVFAPLDTNMATLSFNELSYEQEYRDLLEALKMAGIFSGSVTHLPRKVLSRLLSDAGVPEYQIAQLGVWEALSVMLERYVNGLPWQAILVAAGFNVEDMNYYRLHRDRSPPSQLEAMVFDFASEGLRQLQDLPPTTQVKAKVTTKCQLDLLVWLRTVILQVSRRTYLSSSSGGRRRRVGRVGITNCHPCFSLSGFNLILFV